MKHETPISPTEATQDRSKQDAYAPMFARLRPRTSISLEEERLPRKERLAGGLRIFAALGFAEGVAGHITARDPEFDDTFWVNPFGMGFDHVHVSDLIRVDERGEVVEGSGPLNVSAFAIHAQFMLLVQMSSRLRRPTRSTAKRGRQSDGSSIRSHRMHAPSSRTTFSSTTRKS